MGSGFSPGILSRFHCWVNGRSADTIIRIYVSYHYVFVLSVIWALCLDVVLQCTVFAIVPAVAWLSSRSHSLPESASLPLGDMLEDSDAVAGLAQWLSYALLPAFHLLYYSLLFVLRVVPYVGLSIAVVYVSGRFMAIVCDAMLVDGWYGPHELHMWHTMSESIHTRKRCVALFCSVCGLCLGAYNIALPFLGAVGDLSAVVSIFYLESVSGAFLLAINMKQKEMDVVIQVIFTWIRWSAVGVLGIYAGVWSLEHGPWWALSNVFFSAFILVCPHILLATVIHTHRKLVMFSFVARDFLRARFFNVIAVLVSAVGTSFLSFASCHFLLVFGCRGLLPSLLCLYAAMSISVEKKMSEAHGSSDPEPHLQRGPRLLLLRALRCHKAPAWTTKG